MIDGQGDATNSRTTTTCTDGICNLRTVTFNDLFEYDVDGNGSFEDVSDGVILEGRAILGFASQDGRRILMETNLGGGAKKTRTLQTIQVQEGNDSNNNDQNLQEAITSDGVMAETNFAVDVPLQRPPQGSSRYQRNSSADPSIGFIPTLIVAIVSTLILSL